MCRGRWTYRSRWTAFAVSAMLLLLGATAPAASAAPGALDPGFGEGGVAMTSIADGNARATAVAATADGGMVAVGSAVSDGTLGFAITRYSSTGQLDSAFASGGILTANLGSTTSALKAVAVESNGDILVAGSADSGSDTDVLLALYSATGQLVASFGSGGSERVAIGSGGDAQANAIVLDGSSVLVAGRALESGSSGAGYEEFYESFNAATGAADGGSQFLGSFGNHTDTEASALALDGADVLLAGFTATANGFREALVTKLNMGGTLQTGFGDSGVSPLNFGMDAQAAAVTTEASGVIVVAGQAANGQGITEVMLAGLTPSGTLDSSFGSSGVNALAVGSGGNSQASTVATDPSGNLLIAGAAADSTGGQAAMLPLVARFTAAGQLDTRFAPSSSTPGAEMFGCNTQSGFSAGYVDGAGEFVLAGHSGADASHQAFMLARVTDSAAGNGCGGVVNSGGTSTTSTGSSGGSSGGSTSGSSGGSSGSSGSTGSGPNGTTAAAGCQTAQKTFGVLVISACFEAQGSRYLASGAISVDGLSLEASPCTKLLIDPVADTITSVCDQGGDGEVAVSAPTQTGVVSGIPLYRGAIDWTIPTQSGGSLGTIDVGSFAELEGFPLTGQVDPVAQSGGELQLPLNVTLPSPFDAVSGAVTLVTKIGQPVSVDGLSIDVPEVWIGPLDVQSFDVTYSSSTDSWTGSASAAFADPLDYGVSAGAQFHDGTLSGLSAAVSFGDPGVPLGPDGLFLNEVGFGVFTNPLTISGSIGIDYADVVGVSADLTVEIPPGGWAIRLDGQVSIIGIALAGGYIEIDSDGNAFFGGGINWGSCDEVCVNADADGWIDLSHGSFDADVSAQVSVLDFNLVDAALNVSNKSLAVCGSTSFLGIDFALGGVYTFGSGIKLLGGISAFGQTIAGGGGSCDLSGYELTPPGAVIGSSSNGSQAGAGNSDNDIRHSGAARLTALEAHSSSADQLTVRKGVRGLVWLLEGDGASPQVSITGPGGVTLSSSSTGAPVKTSDALILQDPKADTTYVVLAKPAAGKWTITPENGTTIDKIATAHLLPAPQVHASVTGSGLHRVLRYRLAPLPGQTVKLLEEKGKFQHVIATVSKAQGQVAFTPADGPTGRRTIVAQVLQGGTPRKTLTVASYVTPARLGPQRPTRLSVHRSGGRLSIRWRSGGDTTLYVVQVRASTGATTVVQTKATHASVGLSAVAGAKVSVTPRTTTAEQGPAATATVPTPLAPKLRRAPSIRGTARVGDSVTCVLGSWSNHPTRYVVEWLRAGVAIAGADRAALKLSTADKGKALTCTVTARNAVGFAVATSAKVTVAAAAKTKTKTKTPVKKKG